MSSSEGAPNGDEPPDAPTARFHLFPVAFGLLGRLYAPGLAAEPDALVLVLPGMIIPGVLGDVLTALVVAGAFGAFLSTTSGLVVSLAGVVSHELLGGSVRGFRVAAIGSALVPLGVALLTETSGLAGSVGLVFAFTASTLCPVLLLGIWWRGLTARGAIAGMASGALACGGAILVAPFLEPGWARVLLEKPAAWTMPLAAAVVVLVSRADRSAVPRGADRFLARLHLPEAAPDRAQG